MEVLTTSKYVRKPFEIEAVRVTAENMALVAAWCKGDIRTEEKTKSKYISVEVERPLSERQTMAYVGDWVMYAGKSFKVYNNKAFEKSFDPVVEEKDLRQLQDQVNGRRA